MTLLYNRFVEIRFLSKDVKYGGCAAYIGGRVELPPTIRFNVTHTSDLSPNDAEITIINMSPESQEDLLKEGDTVELEAGYWPLNMTRQTGLIFKGQIRRAVTSMQRGVESETTIYFGDGDDAFAHARTRRRFKDPNHKEIMDDIIDDMGEYGIEPGEVDVPSFVEGRPRTIDRLSRFEIEDIMYQHDLQASIQDGVFNIYPRDRALERTAIVLGPDTGVIEAPQFTDKGVTIKTLMIPDLRPGLTFTLRNDKVASRMSEECKIESITFTGDNSGGEFGAVIEAKFIGENKVIRSRERFIGGRT